MKKNYSSTKSSGNLFRKISPVIFLVILLSAFSFKSMAALQNPTTVTCTATSPTQVTVTWSSSAGASYYYVQLDQQPVFSGGWGSGIGIVANSYTPAPTTTFVFSSGINPGQTYYAHVAAVSSGWTWSGASNSNGETTPIPYFTFSQDIGTTLLVSWAEELGASQYIVQWCEHGTSNWNATPGVTNLSAKISNLQPYTTYDFRLAIYKSGTFWAWSQTETHTTIGINFYTNYDIGTTLQLNWNNQSFASNCIIQYRPMGSSNWIGMPVSALTSSIKITNLMPYQNYECQLKVYKNNILWGASQISNFTTGYTAFYINNDIGTTLQLDWNFSNFNPWEANLYTIQYRSSGNPNWTSISSISNANRLKFTTFLPDQDYEFKVKVYKNNLLWGTSDTYYYHTNAVYFNTLADNGTSMDIEWPSIWWASQYQLQYSLPAMTTWISTSATSNSYTTISPILSGQDYYVRLKVSDWNGYWGTTKAQKVGRSSPSGKMLSGNVADNSTVSTNLNIYPNPFVEQINLEIFATQESPCNWTIYDVTGKQILTGNQAIAIGNNTLNIDANQLTKGVYMLTTIINTEKHDFRILKQ